MKGSNLLYEISEPLDRVQDPRLGRAAVVINDVQWADATTLELLDYLLAVLPTNRRPDCSQARPKLGCPHRLGQSASERGPCDPESGHHQTQQYLAWPQQVCDLSCVVDFELCRSSAVCIRTVPYAIRQHSARPSDGPPEEAPGTQSIGGREYPGPADCDCRRGMIFSTHSTGHDFVDAFMISTAPADQFEILED
jgi:hypothetical protein